ncbi:MAG: hypothetical protein OM95_04610 [Bdellovibrio sp. ArHS]|uniref:hypothetical protein n=1 Tax=Bdellovibrio sp. ArHS TaxID=1569284 RepID=UPI0005826AE0|nr:hypothetical protein [Bdellovibrio sp. ArHS]KHD89115.1 MAG: hypothetical protein OM95_04610 [Bdellovibrio sp. ArHS]
MRFLIFISLILSASLSWAQESRAKIAKLAPETPAFLSLYLLNSEMRYERANSQEIENVHPLSLSFGLQKKRLSLMGEYARYSEDTGNATSSIARTHQELLLWGRYHLVSKTQDEYSGSLYGGLGLGGYQEEVKTTLMGDSRTDKENLKMLSGLAVGAEAAYQMQNFGFVAGLEGRALIASDFDPNPVWSIVLRFGFRIPL